MTSQAASYFAHLPSDSDKEKFSGDFPVSYSKTVAEVFEDITKLLINITQTLDILDVFGDRRYPESTELASWAMNWQEER